MRNITYLSVPVNQQSQARTDRTSKYTVTLHFLEPDEVEAGERLFDVAIQDQPVLTDFDVVQQAGGLLRGVVRQFRGVAAGTDITITLTPKGKAGLGPVLSGVELVAE